MGLLTPAFGLLFWTLIAFLVVFFILRKYAWPAIIKGLHEREQGIGIGYEVFNNFVVSFDALDEVDVLNFQYKF